MDLKRLVIVLVASFLTLLAYANVAAASGPFSYQPEVPEKLRR